jgi:hypothetical protein
LLLDFDVFNHTEMCVWADYISVMFGWDLGLGLVWFCWHPHDVIGSPALPLCGAAPTFLCRRKEK